MPQDGSTGNAALDRANQFAQRMGIEDAPSPETEVGAESFLERMFPGLSAKMADASPEERRQVAREAIKAQADADPDSLLNVFGFDAMKEMFRKLAETITGPDLSQHVQEPAPPGANPATAGQATRAIVGQQLPPEMQQ